jgi:hypothetical protein
MKRVRQIDPTLSLSNLHEMMPVYGLETSPCERRSSEKQTYQSDKATAGTYRLLACHRACRAAPISTNFNPHLLYCTTWRSLFPIIGGGVGEHVADRQGFVAVALEPFLDIEVEAGQPWFSYAIGRQLHIT